MQTNRRYLGCLYIRVYNIFKNNNEGEGAGWGTGGISGRKVEGQK